MEPFEKHQFFEGKKDPSDKVYLLVPARRKLKVCIYLVSAPKK